MKKILTILAFMITPLLAFGQWERGSFTVEEEYCHLDIVKETETLHKDYTNTIRISNGEMVIHLDKGDSMVYGLGPYVTIDGQPTPYIREVVRLDDPRARNNRYLAFYEKGKHVSVYNRDLKTAVWFYLKESCEDIPMNGDDKWRVTPNEVNKDGRSD